MFTKGLLTLMKPTPKVTNIFWGDLKGVHLFYFKNLAWHAWFIIFAFIQEKVVFTF